MNVTTASKKARLVEQAPTGTRPRAPSSYVLEQVISQAPADYFTLGWLTSTLHQRSFGLIIVLADDHLLRRGIQTGPDLFER